jgi:hypothetical protein
MYLALYLTIAALPLCSALSVSKTGRCGESADLTCLGSVFGSCCSQYNYCGSASAYCGTGCQARYGSCSTSAPPSTSPITSAKTSTDGSCGGTKGYSCLNSAFGNCCSQYGYCGKSSAYCGTTCNSKFGTCFNSQSSSSSTPSRSIARTSTSSAAVPSLSIQVSTNARCGKGFTGFTCSGSRFGNCCSQYSYW